MDKVKEEQLEEVIKNNMQNVRNAGVLDGVRGIAGAILEMCNKKQNPALTVNEIKQFCEKGLGLKQQAKGVK